MGVSYSPYFECNSTDRKVKCVLCKTQNYMLSFNLATRHHASQRAAKQDARVDLDSLIREFSGSNLGGVRSLFCLLL